MLHQLKEHVLPATLKEEYQDNFDGGLEAK